MTAPKRNTPAIALRMQTALTAGGLTYDDLVAVSGLAKESVARWVKTMRSVSVIHIERYVDDKRGHPVVPVFRWGKKPDTPRPGRKLTSAQQMAKLRARRKQEVEPQSLEDTL